MKEEDFGRTKSIFLNSSSELGFYIRRSIRRGDEKMWWKGININPLPIAMKLWKQGRMEGTAIVPEVRKTANTKIQISQPRLAGEINGRVGPIGAPTAPADEGSSE